MTTCLDPTRRPRAPPAAPRPRVPGAPRHAARAGAPAPEPLHPDRGCGAQPARPHRPAPRHRRHPATPQGAPLWERELTLPQVELADAARRPRARLGRRDRDAPRRRLLLRPRGQPRLDRPGRARRPRRARLAAPARGRPADAAALRRSCTRRSPPSAPGSPAATRRCSRPPRSTTSCPTWPRSAIAAGIAAVGTAVSLAWKLRDRRLARARRRDARAGRGRLRRRDQHARNGLRGAHVRRLRPWWRSAAAGTSCSRGAVAASRRCVWLVLDHGETARTVVARPRSSGCSCSAPGSPATRRGVRSRVALDQLRSSPRPCSRGTAARALFERRARRPRPGRSRLSPSSA